MLVWQAHKGKIESVSFAPDGQLLATATGGTRTVSLWEPTTGQLARKLTGDWPDGRGLEPVKSVAFAPQAPLFAAGTARSVTVWNTTSWEPVADLKAEYVYELAFGPGKKPLLAASNEDRVGLWDDAGQPTGTKLRSSDRRVEPRRGVAALDFSPDGKLLATTTRLTAMLWDTGTGAIFRGLPRPHGSNRGAIRFSPDGARVAQSYGKWVAMHALTDGLPTLTLQAGSGRNPAVWAIGWASDGKVMMTAGSDGLVRFWDAIAGAELRSFEWGIGKIYGACFSPDGQTCAACGEKGQLVIWDVDL